MKKILCFFIMLLYTKYAIAETITYNQIGNTIYGSDGSRMSKVGNTYYTNDGTRYSRIRNTIYGSDGSRISKVGNTYYSNNGTRYSQIGNTIYGSDGSRMTTIGNTTYANNNRYSKSASYQSAIKVPTQQPQFPSNYYDSSSGSDDGAAIAAAAVAVVAIGALIGIAMSKHNKETEILYYNHLRNFEPQVMNKRL